MTSYLLPLVPVFIAVLAIPLLYDKVPRNRWYGFRTTTSLSSDELWYTSSRMAAKGMCIAAAVWLMAAFTVPLLMEDKEQAALIALWLGSFCTFVALVVCVMLSSRQLHDR